MGALKPVKVGLIGCGAIAIRSYMPTILKKYNMIDMVKCADTVPERAALFAEKFGMKACTNEEIYNDPEIEVVLLDSLNKRIRFLNAVIDELGLQKITALHGRAEDYAKKKEFREQFDLCVSRAVANLSTLCEYCLPFVGITGYFCSYKSADSDKEIKNSENAVKILGGEIKSVDKFNLPGTDMGRAIVNVEKIKNTPKKYPRKAGLPAKEPLT